MAGRFNVVRWAKELGLDDQPTPEISLARGIQPVVVVADHSHLTGQVTPLEIIVGWNVAAGAPGDWQTVGLVAGGGGVMVKSAILTQFNSNASQGGHRIGLLAAKPANLTIQVPITSWGNPGSTVWRDRSATDTLGPIQEMEFGLSIPQDFDGDALRVPPGACLVMQTRTINLAIHGGFVFREYPATALTTPRTRSV